MKKPAPQSQSIGQVGGDVESNFIIHNFPLTNIR